MVVSMFKCTFLCIWSCVLVSVWERQKEIHGSGSGLKMHCGTVWPGHCHLSPPTVWPPHRATQSHTEPHRANGGSPKDKDKHSPTFQKSHTNMAPTQSNTGLTEEVKVRSSTWHEHRKSLFFFRLGLFAFSYHENVGVDYYLWSQATATLTHRHQLSLCNHCVCLCVRVIECVAVYFGICLFLSWRVSSPKRMQFFHTDMWCVLRWDGMGPPSSQLASLNILPHYNTFFIYCSFFLVFYCPVFNSIYIYVLQIND